MSTFLVTNSKKTSFAKLLSDSISQTDLYYLFLANHKTFANDDLAEIKDTVFETQIDLYKNLIQGKKITSADVKLLIDKNSYVLNTSYDMYEHDIILANKQFFVSVDEGSYIHVYKCLDNNRNSVSTVQPNFSHISGANTLFYRTSDGYAWKYMYSFTDADKLKFASTKYIPVVANSVVSNSAEAGVIDVIKIETIGRKYDNYLNGSFGIGNISIGGNSVIHQISNDAKNSNGFYSGCLLYLNTGIGSGQYRSIKDYYSNSTGKYIVTNSAFTTIPINGTGYQIYPKVNVYGTKREQSNVVARALINALAINSVYRVEILEKGLGYTYGVTANVYANSVVGVQAASSLKVILPPRNGHGYDAADELLASHIEISSKFITSESNTISIENGFKQIGLIKNPLFANVIINVTNSISTFISEPVFKISPSYITSNASMNTTSAILTTQLDSYLNNIKVGNDLYLETNNSSQLATVSAVNSSTITLTNNGFFDSSNATVYFANKTNESYCHFSNVVSISVSNLHASYSAGDLIVGKNSGARATINSISRAGETKNFDTFINMYKYTGSLDSGTFIENETIWADSITSSNAILHSAKIINSVFTIYATNLYGNIGSADVIVGSNSGAISTIDYKYDPELEFNSGQVIYVENIDRVERSANTSETFQIIFEF